MPTVARIIGGPGTGKTTRLLELMDKAIAAGGYNPYQIGFVSFTRAARLEAAERVAEKFNVPLEDLQRLGWFSTVHAACFRLIGAKQDTLIADTVKDRQWVSENIDEPISGLDGEAENPFGGKTAADRALSLWSTARSKLCSFSAVHEVARYCEPRTPEMDFCRNVIDRYEQAKRLDGRYDFTDLVCRYAGISSRLDGPSETRDEGLVPDVPVWFLDEQQDTSALLDKACRKLVSSSRWVYLALDPFQSIFSFAGASYQHAMAWDVQKEDVLQQSYRCPREIGALAESCIQQCSDYWDRGIKPANHSGEIILETYSTPWTRNIDLSQGDWLLLGRTNFIANRLAQRIKPLGVPWVPTTGGNNTWNAPVRNRAIRAMMELSRGGPVDGDEWRAILKEITAKGMFVKGTKKDWEAKNTNGELRDLETISDWGGTDLLASQLRAGTWHGLIEHAKEFQTAWNEYGHEAVLSPKVRIGTIHSAKGMEADNVVILKTTSEQVDRGYEFQEIANEEHRLAYVAVTRARKRLYILTEPQALYKMREL